MDPSRDGTSFDGCGDASDFGDGVGVEPLAGITQGVSDDLGRGQCPAEIAGAKQRPGAGFEGGAGIVLAGCHQ